MIYHFLINNKSLHSIVLALSQRVVSNNIGLLILSIDLIKELKMKKKLKNGTWGKKKIGLTTVSSQAKDNNNSLRASTMLDDVIKLHQSITTNDAVSASLTSWLLRK